MQPQAAQTLWAAYRATRYEVQNADGADFALHIGETCPTLDALLASKNLPCASFITACNPRSQALSEKDNQARMQALQRQLQTLGYAYLAGQGVARQGDWPAEPSLLVLGLDHEAAMQLAERFEQYAFVLHVHGQTSELVATALFRSDQAAGSSAE